MRNGLYLIVILCTFLLSTQTKAQKEVKFNQDSIPPAFSKLKTYYNQPEVYLSHWEKIKKDIDNKKGDKTTDLFYLYKDRNYFHYKHGDVDSMKKYTPIIKDLSLRLHNEAEYYRSWSLLCANIIYSNASEDDMRELDKMYNDALDRKSEVGLAFSLNEIANFYGANKNYAKALPYITQAMQLFEKLKFWDEYTPLCANYMVILMSMDKKQEAQNVFYHLDSLADVSLNTSTINMDTARILMIKDMASVVFTEPQDTIVLRKYLTEMENLYRKSPHVSRIYLYSTKKEYATLKGDFDILLAYLDSCAEYYQNSHNMTNLKRMYNNKASALHQSHRYDEAYLMLRKYVSLSDSLYKNDTQKQLNELSTRYNLNKLELEARDLSLKARNIQFFYACTLIVVLVAALIIGIKFYRHKLKNNRLLRKQAQELQQANEKAQQAQLMKTAFIQNMNHEVRTPLNAIVGFSECLAEIPMSQEETREISATIKKNSDNLLKIISDMISIANIDSGDQRLTYQDIPVNKFANKLLQEMKEYIQPKVKFYYTPCQTDYILSSNEDIVHQILINLLHNALKFTSSGEVELSYEVDNKNNKLYFHVRDTGIGVKSELKEKIFSRFYKVDSFIPGAGLGLSLCRILAERIKARVYLDDTYHDGCLFTFEHPLK
ncbi:HAMP domain-containing histidine kinase [Bacteroides cellulosilyticus]|uniref:sensor histidine kinase n=2 Tax=Bacteroides TaxID=816 RepID=UPI001CCBA349|nr:HAMP domain-containing sensor histidine kinase [Bacteroides cellulosilyticus]UBD67394.1 HAMP domain-containing histidine kinase [Bacteroides cellulosilyticus]